MSYKIIIDGKCVKTFLTETKAYTWLILKGYVYWDSNKGFVLDNNVKIEECE